MRYKRIFAGIFMMIYSLLITCTNDHLEPEQRLTLKLRWIKGHEQENWEEVATGLRWSFSFLGATLPKGSMANAINRLDEFQFALNLEALGFTEQAEQALLVIVDRVKQSEEYQLFGGIDVGRFLVLCLHSSWHYYKITGAATSIAAFKQRQLNKEEELFPVLQSSVSKDNRMLKFQIDQDVTGFYFIAEETIDELDEPDYHIDRFEVFDIMANGQLRFAIYDEEGQLAPAAPIFSTEAGKPSKCLWCHETNIQPLFRATPVVDGFMKPNEFVLKIDSANKKLQTFREDLQSELNFSKQAEHTLSELLYIPFMEPSVFRIAQEWNMPVEQVEILMEDYPTHTFSEFPFLGDLYFRRWVDSLAPYDALTVPHSVREPNDQEPNFFE